jgi:hypothetical protein
MAADIDSLVVKIEADISSLSSQLLAGQKVVSEAAQSIERSLGEMSQKSEGHFEFLKHAAETALGYIGGEAILEGIRKAAEAIEELFKSGMEEATKKEDALQRLNSALALTGVYSKETSADLKEFAVSIEETTKYTDYAVLSTAALIQSIGKLSTEGLKQATSAAVDLSAALGIDLDSAARLVGKAAEGHIEMFKRYGIEIEAGASKSETFANTLRALAQFQGAAANQTLTYSGAVEQLGHAWDNVKAEMGSTLTSSGALVGTIEVLKEAFTEVAKSIKDNKSGLQEFVKEGIIFLADALPLTVAGLEILNVTLTKTYQGALLGAAGFLALHGSLSEAKDMFDRVMKAQDGENGRTEALKKLQAAAQELRDKLVEAAEDETAVEEKRNAVSKKQSEIAALNRAALDQLSEKEQERLKNSIEGGQKILEHEATIATDHLALLDKRNNAETEANEKMYAKGLISFKTYEANKHALSAKYANDRTNVVRAEREREFEIEQATAAATGGIFKNLANSIADTQGEGFEIFKTFATAQALIDTYAAANAAYKSAAEIPIIGPELAPIAAGAAIAAGLTNVARIGDMKPRKMAEGGEVPGFGNSDSVPAMLMPGETVVDKSTTNSLKGFLAGNNAIVEELRALRAEVAQLQLGGKLQVTDQFGKSIFEVINREGRAGRKLIGVT